MKKYKIAVLPGDGIGPEVISQGIKILDVVSERFGLTFEYKYGDIGAIAIDKHGIPLPEATLKACEAADAIFMGAIGHPKYDQDPSAKIRPEQGLLALRKQLNLFANIRPVVTHPALADLVPVRKEIVEGTDFIVYRELTGGIYFGKQGREKDSAFDTCTYNVEEISRISYLAFEHAAKRKGKLTLVDKANVLETSRLWRETVMNIALQYPSVAVNYMFIDNAAMQLILNPRQFDIILTSNLFGDILSDEGSILAGSLGLLPSASIGSKNALFEPVHGSYPQAAGKDIANPLAAILSAAMMLDHFNLKQEATEIRKGVNKVMDAGIGTPDLKMPIACSCSQIGDLIAEAVQEGDAFEISQDKVSTSVSTII